jgi:tetratricopeptide (TPR) repeat protein/S1-C subfamily serine protease
MRSVRALLPLVVLLAGAVGAGEALRGRGGPLSGAEVYRRALPGVAWIEAAGQGRGTGWLLDRSRRWLVTCYHLVGENKTAEVIFPVRRNGAWVVERDYYLRHRDALKRSGHLTSAKVLIRRPESDLALLQLDVLPADAVEVVLATERPRPGDRVHVLGNRGDLHPLLWGYGAGSVRQLLTLREGYFNGGRQLALGARVVLASVPVNEGDSGGPLLDRRGRVVGVCAAVEWEAQGSGLFIDVDEVRALASLVRPEETPGPEQGPREIYRRGVRSLALVVQADPHRRATGWLLDRSRRLLLTTAEAVGTRETVEVVFPLSRGGEVIGDARAYRDKASLKEKGALVIGCVLATDARRNLALLELSSLPAEAAEAALAAEPPAPGDALHLLGNPERVEVLWAYTAGWVRQLGHANLGRTTDGPDPAVVVVQAPLSEGDGGGPVLDEQGRVVAVITGKSGPQQQVAYCLGVAEVRDFLRDNEARWNPRGAGPLCDRGDLFLKARQYDRAILDFTEALKADPTCARACSERGRAYLLRGDLAAAVRDCTRALELDPKLAAAHVHRAAALLGRGELREALADCDAAILINARGADAYSVRALVRLEIGDADKALADCDEALWLDPKLATAYQHRGLVYARRGDHVAALRDYDRAIDLDPHLADAFRARGDLRWGRSDVAAALADYSQALALAPDDAPAHLGRGRALAARGEMRAALDDFRAAIRSRPKLLPAVLKEVLDQGERIGDPARTAQWYRQALETLRPAWRDRADLDRRTSDGLTAAAAESDPARRAARLRKALDEVCAETR